MLTDLWARLLARIEDRHRRSTVMANAKTNAQLQRKGTT